MPSCGLAKAAAILRNGGIVAYPTESVYGLGCDPCNRGAVMRLLRIKRRVASKGLIVIAARLGHTPIPWDRRRYRRRAISTPP